MTDVCEPEPFEPPDGGNFIADPCPEQEQRLAFDFTLGDDTVRALDRTTIEIGPLVVRVPYAEMLYPQPQDPDELCGPSQFPIARFVVLRPS